MRIEPLWSFEPEIRELLPFFLDQGRERLTKFDQLIQRSDFEGLRRLGHGLKGSGAMYDLSGFSVLGEEIERAAIAQDRAALTQHCQRLRDLLDALEQALARDVAGS